MSYAVKKAGVAFKPKINVNPDLTGKAANFSMLYIDDATGTKTDVSGSFTESPDAPGLYFAPSVTIPTVGDYTFNIVNSVDGLGNVSTPVVVMGATIDDVNTAIANAQTVIDTIAADVDGLNGQDLQDIKTAISDVHTLLDDGDPATRNSVIEFLQDINAAIADSGSGLAALKGFTDDVENMLLGTEFLADGTTANPFYDATNPGVATAAALNAGITTLSTAIANAVTNDNTNKDTIITAISNVQTVVDANKLTLEDAGYGLNALKTLLDSVISGQGTDTTTITDILNDGVNGLAAIKTLLNTMDGKLDSIEGKIDAIGGTNTAIAFV